MYETLCLKHFLHHFLLLMNICSGFWEKFNLIHLRISNLLVILKKFASNKVSNQLEFLFGQLIRKVDLVQQLLKLFWVAYVPWNSRKHFESIAWMMVWSSSFLKTFHSFLFKLLWHILSRYHTNIRTHSQGIDCRHSVTMEQSTVKQYKISSLGVDLKHILKRFFSLVFLRHHIPVIL